MRRVCLSAMAVALLLLNCMQYSQQYEMAPQEDAADGSCQADLENGKQLDEESCRPTTTTTSATKQTTTGPSKTASKVNSAKKETSQEIPSSDATSQKPTGPRPIMSDGERLLPIGGGQKGSKQRRPDIPPKGPGGIPASGRPQTKPASEEPQTKPAPGKPHAKPAPKEHNKHASDTVTAYVDTLQHGTADIGQQQRPQKRPPMARNLNSGDIPLIATSTEPCSFDRSIYSSADYPENYEKGENCYTTLSTREPRYLRVKSKQLQIPDTDKLVLSSVYEKHIRLRSSDRGASRTLLSSTVNINFTASTEGGGHGFQLDFEVVNTDCHKMIEMEKGSKGAISKINYSPGTICEYWIQAPPGFAISLKIVKFNIGLNECEDDFLLIDRAGDPRYETATTKYCGSNVPESRVLSQSNKMNILLYGHTAKERNGFIAGFNAVQSKKM